MCEFVQSNDVLIWCCNVVYRGGKHLCPPSVR